MLLYGLSVARALNQGLEDRRRNQRPIRIPATRAFRRGTESRSTIRAGLRFTHAAVRFDGGMIFGLTSRDPSFGFTGGVTYVFRGFTLP